MISESALQTEKHFKVLLMDNIFIIITIILYLDCDQFPIGYSHIIFQWERT